MDKIILASQSPRRAQLLREVGIDFDIIPYEGVERVPDGISIDNVAEFLAIYKASAISDRYPDNIVIGADTIVVHDGQILGKPSDREDAIDMLHRLSGDEHQVYTGVCIKRGSHVESLTSRTNVEFYKLNDKEIEDYVSSGEPMDKAGGYGIQGMGRLLVRRIDGDYYTVVGLPIAAVVRVIKTFTGGK